MSGEPPINFDLHRARNKRAGGREEFEAMLALLVTTTVAPATRVFPNPGDWGIDVFVGDLHGSVAIWQAKYFIDGIRSGQQGEIRKSFCQAVTMARSHGYRVDRWVLCVPASMDAPTHRWWRGWKAKKEAEHGLEIELWDETVLSDLLLRPEAAHVRRHFYHPYREKLDESPPRPIPAAPPDRRWRGGNETRAGGEAYLLHDDAAEEMAGDHTWAWRDATADRTEPGHSRVWLRQVEVLRPSAAAAEARNALHVQARLVRKVRGAPALAALHDDRDRTTLVTDRPPGRTWSEVLGPAPAPLDRLTAATALATAAEVAAALDAVHRHGHAHRALHPERIVLVDRPRRVVLRDLGRVGLPPRTGEGHECYRAPEQMRMAGGRRPGPPADVYQLAALLYHTLTGHLPSPAGSPPVRVTLAGFPEATDDLIRQALDSDPARRPESRAVAAALRDGRQRLSHGGVQ